MMAAEPELYQPGALVEDEPRYLRRQRPVEIRRRKFGQRTLWMYARNFFLCAAAVSLALAGYAGWRYLMSSPRFALQGPDGIEVVGLRYVPPDLVLQKFAEDRGQSVLRIPLADRRAALEAIPWIERASVRRILPNRIQVAVTERTPVAFLRLGSELALIDASGVILDRPLSGEFAFPVVSGLTDAMSLPDRARRTRFFGLFMGQIEDAHQGAANQVSEVDLSDETDLRATLAGMPELGDPEKNGQGAVLVHFGTGDFKSKFQVLVENIAHWRAEAGRVESVDLRFDRQVVVNPEARPMPLARR